MSKIKYLISVASWEDRFLLGVPRSIEKYNPETVHVFYYKEYKDETTDNRGKIRESVRLKQIKYIETELSFINIADSWRKLSTLFSDNHWVEANVAFDISTAPREAIWNILFLLGRSRSNISYIYHSPDKYGDWLSREPGRPRLIYHQSGIMKMGLPTAILIITGFDAERAHQLINFFEPHETMLGIQTGDQYENNRENVKKHEECLKGFVDIKTFEIDAYSKDHGYSVLRKEITPLLNKYNIVATSLGPKPSAVALFQLNRDFPEIGLAYTPSHEFNIDYSSGIGESIDAQLKNN